MAVADYTAQINTAAAKYGVDPMLVAAVITAESGGDPNATSRTGAQGLMQLEPATAAALGVSNAYDPAQNIDGGTHYLAQQLKTFHGDVRLAVAAYNAGPGAVEAAGGIPNNGETPAYVQTVIGLWQRAGGGTVTGTLQSVASGYGSNTTPAAGSPSATTTTITTTTPQPAPSGGFRANDPLGIGAAFDRAITAAGDIATEVFLGAIALALLSGGILWLASTDSTIRGAAVKAAAA